MPMVNLLEALQDASNRHVALGHFNFSELVVLKAVVDTARELKLPVVVGVSEGEREFVGVRQGAALVKSYREEFGLPIFLNADHTHSLEKSVEAAKAGFDLIVFDNSNQPFEENVKRTKEAVEAAKSINPEILVEGEIGYIGASSSIHASVPKDLSPLTTPEEAKQFVDSTAVDLLAPALGTMHGMLKSMLTGKETKHLNIARIGEIKAATGIFLTLHGGSGTNSAEFVEGIHAGLNLIHINTELRVAWRRGLEEELAKKPEEVTPYHLLPGAYRAVSEVVRSRLQLFSGTSAKEAHS
jgi:fructose-bisphosphate aldolase, class II